MFTFTVFSLDIHSAALWPFWVPGVLIQSFAESLSWAWCLEDLGEKKIRLEVRGVGHLRAWVEQWPGRSKTTLASAQWGGVFGVRAGSGEEADRGKDELWKSTGHY